MKFSSALFSIIHCFKAACDRDLAGAMFIVHSNPAIDTEILFHSKIEDTIGIASIKATTTSEVRVLEKHEKGIKIWQNIFLKTICIRIRSSMAFDTATHCL